ncbi:MAG: aspartyl-phosphate phosphatase Spo0E family protein [Firmicutes bacterium]|nr:aspartyl-phosphate phosphatase Spo0E family protein [Bacillota bacterium]
MTSFHNDSLYIIKEKIEGLRRELNEIYIKKGRYHKDLINKSRELDELIVEYSRRTVEKNIKQFQLV